MVVIALNSVLAALVGTVLCGVMSGFGLTVGFAAAKNFSTAPEEYDSLAVAWVNFISLFGAFFPPLVFSYAVNLSGYPTAWVAGAVMNAICMVPLFFLRDGSLREGSRLSGRPSSP